MNKAKLLIPICSIVALATTTSLVACAKGNKEEEEKDEPIVLQWDEDEDYATAQHSFKLGDEYTFTINVPDDFQKTTAEFSAEVEYIEKGSYFLKFEKDGCKYKIDDGEYQTADVEPELDRNMIDLKGLPENRGYALTLKVKLSVDGPGPETIKDIANFKLAFRD